MPAMPLVEEMLTTREPLRSTARSNRAAVMRSWASRFTASTALHSWAVILTSERSRVMPALWTRTSAPPYRSSRCAARRAGASSAVMSTWNAVP